MSSNDPELTDHALNPLFRFLGASKYIVGNFILNSSDPRTMTDQELVDSGKRIFAMSAVAGGILATTCHIYLN